MVFIFFVGNKDLLLHFLEEYVDLDCSVLVVKFDCVGQDLVQYLVVDVPVSEQALIGHGPLVHAHK